MSEQPKEPSQWAKDAAQACMQLAKWPPEHDIREWMAPIQSAIDAATAQRDAEIERLREELEAKNRIIARSDSEIDRLMDRMERIAQLEALLDGAMEVFKNYLNVPESLALREKWEKLKGQ